MMSDPRAREIEELIGKVAALELIVARDRDEIARLKDALLFAARLDNDREDEIEQLRALLKSVVDGWDKGDDIYGPIQKARRALEGK